MAAYKTGITNGTTWAWKHTVTTADQTATYVEVDFQTTRVLTYSVMVLASNGAQVVITGALITEPSTGNLKIANGGSLTLTAGQVIHVLALADSSVYTYEDTGL